MEVTRKVWRPIARRWGTKGVIVAVIITAAILISGGSVMAAFFGGAGRTNDAGDISLQRGLVGEWNFNGNAKDQTPNGNNAIPSGATPPSLTTDRKGKAASAYSFNGTSSYMDVPSTSSLNVGASMTASAWFYPTSNATYQVVASRVNVGYTQGWEMANSWGAFRVTLRGSGGNVTAGSVTLNQWHLITFTYSGTSLKLYADGSLIGSSTVSTASLDASVDLQMSRRVASSDGYLSGSIDDVRLYNRAINAGEVAALSNQYDPSLKSDSGESGLIAHWGFDGNYKDSTPLANNLTVSGTALTADRKGRASAALSLNGTTDYVYGKIGNGTYFGGNNPLSVAAWVYVTASSSGPVFGVSASPPGGGWNMPFLSVTGTTVYGWIYNNTKLSATVSANQWHHLALTYTPGTTIFYVDGQQVGTTGGTYAASGLTDYFTTFISGTKPAGVASYLNTPIDDVRAYSKVLSAAEIQALSQSYNSQISLGGSGSSGSVSLGQGLVGDWSLNGNAKDSTPHAGNGTIAGATLTSDRKGRANSAYSFNGTSSTISIADNNILDIRTGSMTWSLWFSSTSTTGFMYRKSDSCNINGQIMLFTSGKVESYVTTGGVCTGDISVVALSPATYTDGNWHLATSVLDRASNRLILYVDGVSVSNVDASALAGIDLNAANGISIGSSYGGAPFTNGKLDDLRVWNRALSQAEVTALYADYR